MNTEAFKTHDGRTLQQAASDLVQREVLCCMSSMVATLAQAGFAARTRHPRTAEKELASLSEQAFELAAPVLDYEGAALEAGWSVERVEDGCSTEDRDVEFFAWRGGTAINPGEETAFYASAAEATEAACRKHNIEPHELEVYEHWAVSTWLAEKLQAAGERVDTDFAGLNVWARTTTGQALSMDAVIERITRDLHAPHSA